MSIESVLAKYLQSSAGRKKVQSLMSKSGKTVVDKKLLNASEYKWLLDDLIHCIQAYLPASLDNSALHSDDAYVVGQPIAQKDGTIKIDISFASDAVFRPSLAPDARWGDGVPNIVLHLSNGWDAHGSVTGLWHGEFVRSRPTYEGDDFMKLAIFDFNTTHAGAIAVLGSQYK